MSETEAEQKKNALFGTDLYTFLTTWNIENQFVC